MYRTLERESGCYERDGERTDIQHRGDREIREEIQRQRESENQQVGRIDG